MRATALAGSDETSVSIEVLRENLTGTIVKRVFCWRPPARHALLHFLPATTARIEVPACARLRAFRDFDFAAAVWVGAAILFRLFAVT